MDRITLKELAYVRPGSKQYATDAYYVKLANGLLNRFNKLGLNLGENEAGIMRYAAITLACYMEDVVADSGVWRSFSSLCRQVCGQEVPMYHAESSAYFPDEPSESVVRFLVWHAATEIDDIWWDANHKELRQMATAAYELLNDVFEDSPINDELTRDLDEALREADKNFDKMRFMLAWLFKDCYLTRSIAAEKILQNRLEETESLNEMFTEDSMRFFYAIMHSIFACKVGPLALMPKDYLAALMRTRGMLDEAAAVEAIEVLPLKCYQYTLSEDGKAMQLLSTSGKRITIDRNEITMSDEHLNKHDGLNGIFVNYLGSWRLNGIMRALKNCVSNWSEHQKKDPDYLPKGTRNLTGEMLLKQANGKQIIYFANVEELKKYLQANMKHRPQDLKFLDAREHTGKHPLLFIDKDAEKYASHFSFGFTPCIADPDNPYYDPIVARKNAIEVLWNPQAISTECVLYLLDHGYLPDLLNDDLLCRESTIEEKQQDARFLLRYMRKEEY